MLASRIAPRAPIASQRAAAQFLKSSSLHHAAFRPTFVVVQHLQLNPTHQRAFSSSHNNSEKIKEYFEKKTTEKVLKTPSAWPHPGYTEEQMKAVEPYTHREPENIADRVAYSIINFMKWGMNTAVGYKEARGANTEEKYMIRNIFLESVAGVPGMVAGMIRHLHSMRRMKRDNGWIETLLEESYNERMHLLVFMKMHQPGTFMRLMVLGAQGVWFNAMFVAYLISPRVFHRFVGYLEELATSSYTRQIEELEAGLLPKWKDLDAPEIAVDYWKMPEGNRKMIDLLYYIRADESKHREVNHTLSNLNQTEDPNPYVSEYRDPSKPHPGKDLLHQKPTGWERNEVI